MAAAARPVRASEKITSSSPSVAMTSASMRGAGAVVRGMLIAHSANMAWR